MNSLSLIIYFSNAISAIAGLFVIAIIATIISGIVFLVNRSIARDSITLELKSLNRDRTTPLTKEEAENEASIAAYMKDHAKFKAAFRKAVILLIIIFPIPFLIPSKNTLLLIAASEYGETLVKHENVSKIVDPSLEFLSTWIKQETESLKTKTDEMKTKNNDKPTMKDKIVDHAKEAILDGVKNKIDETIK
jgi:hypothetical protein